MNSRTIQISLPKIPWKIFFKRRVAAMSLCFGVVVYWYFAIHPYLKIDSAYLAAPYLDVQSDRPGRVAQAPHQVGSPVEQGDILFSLSTDTEKVYQIDLQEQIDSLEQSVVGYERALESAMKEYFAIRTEIDLGFSPEDAADQVLLKVDENESQAKECRAQIALAKKNMNRFVSQQKQKAIYAPFSGVIVKQQKREGDVVQFGDVIYSFCDPSHLWVEAVVPERAIARVKVGQKATVELLADKSRKCQGSVSWISPVALPEKGGVPIRIALDQTKGPLLLPNLTATVKIKIR